MRQSPGGRSRFQARRLDRRCWGGTWNELHRSLVILAVAGVVYGVLSGLATSARANDLEFRGDPVATLSSYVQLVAATQPDTAAAAATSQTPTQTPTSVAGSATGDDAYAALRAFAQRIAADPPQSTTDRVKVADADNAFDALQQWLQGGSTQSATPAPAPAPKTKGTKAAKPAPVVAATYVGSKVCYGCHSSQDDAFGYTLMGRLQKQGKLQCEILPRAGLGARQSSAAGAASVASFHSARTTTSRTAEQNNAICLGCHERGDRSYWPGSTHEDARLRLHQLPHDHEGCVAQESN